MKQNGIEPTIIANTIRSRIGRSWPLAVGFGQGLTQNASCGGGGCQILHNWGKKHLIQLKRKHREGAFVPYLRTPQLKTVVSWLICSFDGRRCRAIAVALQNRTRHRSAIRRLAERIRKVHGWTTDAVFENPFRFAQFAIQLGCRQLADGGMRHGVRSEKYSLATHGPNLFPSQHPISQLILRQDDSLLQAGAIFFAAIVWKGTQILDNIRSGLKPRMKGSELEAPAAIQINFEFVLRK